MAAEGAELGKRGGDARRLLLARLVLDHRLGEADPWALPNDRWEQAVAARLLGDGSVSLSDATSLLAA
jgi:hypothetical protein